MNPFRLRILTGALAASFIVTSPFAAAEDDVSQIKQQLDELDQKIRVLQRLQEIDKENASAKSKETPSVMFGNQGFGLRSGDGANELRIRGYLQADSRWYSDSPTGSETDKFLLRRVRPIFEGKFLRDYSFRIMPDFGGGTTVLQDAYIDGNYSDPFKIRVGKFKPPVGLERLESGTALSFNERAFPTNLVPNRDIGAQIFGEFFKGSLEYQAGIFDGLVDNGTGPDGDSNNGKDGAVRVFAQPFKNNDWDFARGLGVGVAYTWGRQQGALPSFRSPGQNTFFTYATGAIADGGRTRVSPQFYYYNGPFGVLGEYVVSKQEITRSTNVRQEVENSAWQVLVNWVVFGGEASYRAVTPKNNFNLSDGTWGAVELVARYSEQDNDDDAFAGTAATRLADPASSARKAKDVGFGVNWYLNRYVKLQLNYDQTSFQGGVAAGDRPDEKVLFTRVQLSY
jgi:phosphate-selective porin OprO/OprP